MNNTEVITNVLLIDSFNIETASKSNIKSRGGFWTRRSRAYTCTKARVKPAAHDMALVPMLYCLQGGSLTTVWCRKMRRVSERRSTKLDSTRYFRYYAMHRHWLHQYNHQGFLAHFSSCENRFLSVVRRVYSDGKNDKYIPFSWTRANSIVKCREEPSSVFSRDRPGSISLSVYLVRAKIQSHVRGPFDIFLIFFFLLSQEIISSRTLFDRVRSTFEI